MVNDANNFPSTSQTLHVNEVSFAISGVATGGYGGGAIALAMLLLAMDQFSTTEMFMSFASRSN